MRILLFTGKGGVGKSTVAAGTAALAAAAGHRVLVLSTDAAHSLGDALGAEVGPEPTPVAPGLWAQQVDAQRRFEESWGEVRRYLLGVLGAAGVGTLEAGELTVLPGAEEVLALLELRRQVRSGGPDGPDGPGWDVVVVDCAPTAETLRLLALPEALGSYVARLRAADRGLVKALRPVVQRVSGVPLPDDDVVDALARLHDDLDDVRRLLTGPDASVRVVMTPESVVLAEARRAWTTLSLFGHTVDGVVANRVFPATTDGSGDAWRDGWVAAQSRVMREAAESFWGLPLWSSAYRASEPVGVVELAALAAALYDGDDPLARAAAPAPYAVEEGARPGDGPVLRLPLPGAERGDVDLARRGDELVVTVGSYRRLLALPAALAGHRVAGAGLEAGELAVRFAGTGA
ncbi:ArsA family ATPase [Nocardioides lentus]|uniref:ArsA family ATPase n=1 Tax=Nocardioides lentus TaxID=338077 RepID=A0ABN2P7Q6_9ACTN